MSHIGDRIKNGFAPLRHNEAAVEIGTRNVGYALAIKDGNADLSGIAEEQSVGDINGGNLWRAADKAKRPHPGWSFAWAAQTALPERPRGGSSSSGDSGSSGGGVDHNGLTPYGAKPSAMPSAGFANFVNADGSKPFDFFGTHRGPLGLIEQRDFGALGIQPAGTKLGLIEQVNFGVFGAQPKGTALAGAQVDGQGGAARAAGGTVSGKPVADPAAAADPTAGAGAAPSGSGQGNGAGGAGGAGGSDSVGGGGGGIPGAPASVLPTFDAGHRLDDRYALRPANEPPWASKRPRGWPGIVLAGSNEDAQEDVFVPAGSALVSANAPGADPTLSTAVVDVDKDGAVDTQRRVPLCDFARVVHDPIGLGNNSLSLVLTPTAPFAPRFGGLVTDLDLKDSGVATQARGSVPVVHASLSARHGGPIDTGDSDDPHVISRDADGSAVGPAHISCDALFLKRKVGDGPILFEGGGYPDVQRGTANVPVHIVFDTSTRLGSSSSASPGETPRQLGVWRAFAESFIDDDAPPPDDPPRTPTPDPGGGDGPPDAPIPPIGPDPGSGRGQPGGPQGPNDPGAPRKKGGTSTRPRGGGATGEPFTDPWLDPFLDPFRPAPNPETPRYVGPTINTEARPLAQMHRELGVTALVVKPYGFGCGARDPRNDPRGDAAAQLKHKREDPAILRMEGAWAKVGADCNAGAPSYTNRPGNARYLGGTASGVFALLPPEVGLEDYASAYAPPGLNVSTTYIVALKGKVIHGSGLPDPTGGLCKSGYTWGANASTSAMEFQERNSTGAVASTQTVAKVTGTVPSASSLTANALPKMVGTTGELAPSGLFDNGSTLSTSRALTVTGATTTSQRRSTYQSVTGSDGGSIAVDDAVGIVFVDMSAVTGSNKYKVKFDGGAVAAPGRVVIIQISVPPATPSAQILQITDGSNLVNGTSGLDLDGTGYAQVTLVSNGANWFCKG